MNNLERIKKMNTKELAKVLNGSQCNCCAYKNTLMCVKKNVCEQSNCEEGVKLWLEQDAEFTISEVRDEFEKECENCCSLESCQNDSILCFLEYFIHNYNAVDQKITLQHPKGEN